MVKHDQIIWFILPTSINCWKSLTLIKKFSGDLDLSSFIRTNVIHQRLYTNVWKHACRSISLNILIKKDIINFLEDVSITFIDKTDPSEPLKCENYRKSVLKKMAPLGLNTQDSVWEMFSRITDGMFLDNIYGLRLLLFLLIIYYNCWRSLLKVFLRGWLSVLLLSGFAGKYWKRVAILAPLWWVVLETSSHWGAPWRGCFFNYCYLLRMLL